jgi:hypothetical protein
MLRTTLLVLGAATCLGLGVGAAQAAPLGALDSARTTAPGAAKVAQRCWWRHGVRHCRWYRPRVYGYRYREYGNPDAYRTGSSRWWQEMDRQDRGGRGGMR